VVGELAAFVGVSAVVICTPGPDTALTVRNALAGRRPAGVATAAGVAAGQAVWTVATAFGVAELIQASEPAFLALRFAGAAYLIALGLQSLWAAAGRGSPSTGPGPRPLWTAVRLRFAGRLRSPTGGPGTGSDGSGTPLGRPAVQGPMTPGRGWRQGVVSNLANPKMAAFFLSLLPQFASAEGGVGGVLGLGLLFCLMTFGWLALYSAAVDRARRVLGRPRVRRALEGLSGLVLVGFGARLAMQQR
jgi:threonine/homoserine/homoserine lactone efflux protein